MKRIAPYALITVGLALILTVLIAIPYFGKEASSGEVDLPSSIASLPLVQSRLGEEAIHEISQLHQQAFPLSSGAIGIYGETEQVVLWVSSAEDRSVAEELITRMYAAIAAGRSPFTPLPEMELAGRVVYPLEGLGQQHYYFQSGALVIWAAADPSLAEAALQELMEVFPR